MAINIYFLELNLNGKYFYIKTQKKIFDLFNRKKIIKIPNL